MSDVARSTEVAAADSKASVKPASQARRGLWSPSRPMIDRYKWYEVAALYLGIAVFLFFVRFLNVNLPAGILLPVLGTAGL